MGFAEGAPAPDPVPVAAVRAPDPVPVPAAYPGAPDAPARPFGPAAKVPRRFPAGASGGAPIAGCRLNAMTRPLDPNEPDDPPGTKGGGATTWELSPGTWPPGRERCGESGSWGAGAITELGAIVRSPIWRADARSTDGGGAMRSGCSPGYGAVEFEACRSGGGATTEFCNAIESLLRFSCAASGGGATTEFSMVGAVRAMSAAGVSGASGMYRRGLVSSAHATMLGTARSRFNLIFGGVTIVCERLSAPGGTEIIGCGASSESALGAGLAGASRVSSGGRYSEAV